LSEKRKMVSIPAGKTCPSCHRKHTTVAIENIPMSLRRKIQKLDHHIFPSNYEGSIIMENLGEVWEIYSSTTVETFARPESEKDYSCGLCRKRISKQEWEEFDGMCEGCYYLELQDLDDLEGG